MKTPTAALNTASLQCNCSCRPQEFESTTETDGRTTQTGSTDRLKSAMDRLEQELRRSPKNAEKKLDSIKTQVRRAVGELKESGRLIELNDKGKISINIPYDSPVEDTPF